MKQLIACLFTVLALVGSVQAQETTPWGDGDVNGWSIGIDHTIGGGCFIYTLYEGDTAARIGFDPGSKGFYFMVGDLDWKSMQDGTEYDVVLQMGKRPEWTAIALGSRLGDIPALLVVFDDANFIAEFAGQHYISLRLGGQEIANLSLDGSARAIDEMITCQEAVNNGTAGGPPAGDPFATTPPNNADPFATTTTTSAPATTTTTTTTPTPPGRAGIKNIGR